MNLKGRMNIIAQLIPICNIVCDIGTDHAYIPIFLIRNNICKKAIACDIRKGPIDIAIKNIDRYGFGDFIDTRIGPGLEPVEMEEIDVVIIAGMGGVLISDILKEEFEKAKKANLLVLQAMKGTEILRKWLYDNGFEIVDEELVQEDEKIYNVFTAKWSGQRYTCNDIFYYIGEKLIHKRHPLLKEYVLKKISILDKIIKEQERNTNLQEQIEENKKIIAGLHGVLETL